MYIFEQYLTFYLKATDEGPVERDVAVECIWGCGNMGKVLNPMCQPFFR